MATPIRRRHSSQEQAGWPRHLDGEAPSGAVRGVYLGVDVIAYLSILILLENCGGGDIDLMPPLGRKLRLPLSL